MALGALLENLRAAHENGAFEEKSKPSTFDRFHKTYTDATRVDVVYSHSSNAHVISIHFYTWSRIEMTLSWRDRETKDFETATSRRGKLQILINSVIGGCAYQRVRYMQKLIGVNPTYTLLVSFPSPYGRH